MLYPRGVSNSIRVPVSGQIPVFAHAGDAGADLLAARGARLAPGERALIPTGTRIALPEGTAGFVLPRSGLAARHGVTVVNAPGLIDSGYRGEISVALINTDANEAYEISPGDRIAQLVVMPVPRVEFELARELPEGDRGEGGFGSTGYAASGAAPATVEPGD